MALLGDIYRYFHSWFENKPSRFGWVINDKLAASGRIMSQGQLDWAVKHGIKSVLTIREIPLSAKWFEKHPEIDYKHVKVQDASAPPVEELGNVVNYIDKEIQDRKPVIIHCNGGSGRTSTVLAAYLMMKEKMTAEQAVDKVKAIRGRTIRHKKQLHTLKEYEKIVSGNGRSL